MAAATANCVSSSCYSVSSARESGYGRLQGGGGAAGGSSLGRTAFCGEKVGASLKAQAWSPAGPPKLRRSSSMPAVSAVLAERVDQTIVSVSFPS